MTITSIIRRIGAQRSFDVTTTTGGTKTIQAVEVELASGNNVFVCDAFDDVKNFICNNAPPGDMIIAELVFSLREFNTRDGGKALSQKVSLTQVQTLNTHF